MPDTTPAKKHWIVAAFTPSVEVDEVGVLGTVDSLRHVTLSAAQDRCRELAAQNPSQYYVIFEAVFYAFTDITPVLLRPVVTAVVV